MNMLRTHATILCLTLCAAQFLPAQAPDYAAWTHRATVTVPSPGLTRLDLPLDVLNASASTSGAALADLRVVSPAGVETPCDIEWPRITKAVWLPVADFRMNLGGNTTTIEIIAPNRGAMDEISLQTNAQGFIKAATLEGSNDGTQWQPLASGEVLCRQQGTVRLNIPFPPAAWKRLRITVDDHRTQPVAFTGASVRLQDTTPRTVPHAVSIRERHEEKGETVLTLDLGGPNVFLGVLRVQTPETVFQRDASVREVTAQGGGSSLGSRSIFRVTLDGTSAAELEIPVNQRVSSREIEVRIRHDDSPPLKLDAIEATRHPVPLVFNADAAGAWLLFTGNTQAAAPRYDIAALAAKLRGATANNVTASPLEPNPAFRKEAAMPEVGEAGAMLDVSDWAWRKPVNFTETGVLQVELDTEVLARSNADLRDLRVLQEGRQIPYLLQRAPERRETEATFTEEPDPKKPGLSRWRIALPLAGFPVADILAKSPTPLFDRSMSLSENFRDDFGNPSRRWLGSTSWKQTPSQAATGLRLSLTSRPVGDAVFLETDNGDNAPIQINSLRLTHAVVHLLFRITSSEPVHLCYGHKLAPWPRYDLHLVQSELNAAPKVKATLGTEEKLKGGSETYASSPGVGSTWLWAALALVVAGLLWIVARMLPKEAGT